MHDNFLALRALFPGRASEAGLASTYRWYLDQLEQQTDIRGLERATLTAHP